MKKVFFAAILAVTTLSLTVPLQGYVIGVLRSTTNGQIARFRWRNTNFPITWQMNPVQPANVTGTRTQAEVFASSFAAWQGITTASLSFTQGPNTTPDVRPGDDTTNLVTTNTLPGDLPTGVAAFTAVIAFSSDGPGGQPFAGQIDEADIFFSSQIAFTTDTNPVPNTMDLQSVMTHEVGHLLGLDHSPLVSATMFWTQRPGFIYSRIPSSDDIAGISLLYPSSLFATKGKISGVVRTTANAPLYGAVVVAVNANGTPVASAVTDPTGAYEIEGLDPGAYSVYAEPLDGPTTAGNVSFPSVYPGISVNTSFTTRFR